MDKWGKIFGVWQNLNAGQKIAEGGQAEIFEVLNDDGSVGSRILLNDHDCHNCDNNGPSGSFGTKFLT